jgi:hypothetical protein
MTSSPNVPFNGSVINSLVLSGQTINQLMASLKTEFANPKISESPVYKNVIWLTDLTLLGYSTSFGHISAFNLTDLLVVNVVGNTFETFWTNWLNVWQTCDCLSDLGKVCLGDAKKAKSNEKWLFLFATCWYSQFTLLNASLADPSEPVPCPFEQKKKKKKKWWFFGIAAKIGNYGIEKRGWAVWQSSCVEFQFPSWQFLSHFQWFLSSNRCRS